MKNTLLTTTALAMTTGMAFAEGAVDFKIGGFYRVTAAVSSVDVGAGATATTGGATVGGDYDGFDTLTNSEIHFKPSITLDNGIKIGAIIELEGNNGDSDRIDHDTIYAQGDFGRLEIGSRDSAGKRMQIGAPDVSMVYANSTSLSAFVPFAAVTTFIDNGNDAQRTTYFSPTFGGFKFGVSYARDAGQGNGTVNNNAVTNDIFDLGVSYSGTIGGVDLGLSGRYGSAENNVATFSPDIMGAGISLGFGAVSFGGGYVETDTSATTKAT
jgi:predicted porin